MRGKVGNRKSDRSIKPLIGLGNVACGALIENQTRKEGATPSSPGKFSAVWRPRGASRAEKFVAPFLGDFPPPFFFAHHFALCGDGARADGNKSRTLSNQYGVGV